MGINEQFQTIVYYSDSGDIREILPNQYIKSRKSLNQHLGLPESVGLKFFYFKSEVPLDISSYKIRLGTQREAPRLVNVDGSEPGLAFLRDAAKWILEHSKLIVFKFEGGMGDYVDQTDVVIQLHKKHPDIKFGVIVEHINRMSTLEMIDGWSGIEFYTPEAALNEQAYIIDMKGISFVHGFAPIGKIGVYAGIGGLDKPFVRSNIVVSDDMADDARSIVRSHTKMKNPFVIILHTTSGPTNTKSISASSAIDLLSPLLDSKKIIILHVGGAGEPIIDHSRIISLQGQLQWERVFALMSISDGCVCIDSAIMHIAQHIPLPTVSFWGPTDPVDILGIDPGITIVKSSVSCAGCGRWECDERNCMSQFNKDEVNEAFKIFLRKS